MSEVPDTPRKLVQKNIDHINAETIAAIQHTIQGLLVLAEAQRRAIAAQSAQIEQLQREVDELKRRT